MDIETVLISQNLQQVVLKITWKLLETGVKCERLRGPLPDKNGISVLREKEIGCILTSKIWNRES